MKQCCYHQGQVVQPCWVFILCCSLHHITEVNGGPGIERSFVLLCEGKDIEWPMGEKDIE